MKKIFQAVLALALLSCQKQVSLSGNSNQPQELQKASVSEEPNVTSGVLTFDKWVVNTCYPENVHLLGNMPYTIKIFYDIDKRYYIDYRIDLNNIYGVGETPINL